MIEEYYINALFSAASYANWDDRNDDIKNYLITKGFSEEQAHGIPGTVYLIPSPFRFHRQFT